MYLYMEKIAVFTLLEAMFRRWIWDRASCW